MVVEIPLTQGYVALVDDEDADRVRAAGPWRVLRDRQKTNILLYVRADTRDPITGKRKGEVRMSRFILGAPSNMQVDHRNHDGLDNRRENLRLCTNAENGANRRKQQGTSSQYKGVSWQKGRQKWQAYIQVNGNGKHLGCFVSEIDAAIAYDKAARELHGEFALTNFCLPKKETP